MMGQTCPTPTGAESSGSFIGVLVVLACIVVGISIGFWAEYYY